ncbi:MAG: ABC transporter substrate-binding protein [Eubacteriales bacterium]|nr:ABC transporter substrate-binding protein [Eubacteriales bacterium]
MNRLKKFIYILPAAMLCTGCTAVEAPSTESAAPHHEEVQVDESLIVVGFSQVGAESDWRNAHTESIKAALTPENGFYLIFEDAQQKQENQTKAVRNFILQEVDYIVLSPIVESGWDAVLQEAKDAGIPVILDDRLADVDEDLYTCWLGTNAEREGEMAGHWLEEYLEDAGRDQETIHMVTLQGTLGATAQIGRTNGFSKVLKEHKNWEMMEMMEGDFTQAKGQEVMEELLDKYEDIDVVICENDNMAFGAVDAIKPAERTCGPEGEITIISFDAVQAAFDAMIAGDINATFECNPLHGPKLAEILKTLAEGGEVDKISYMEETYFDTTMDLESIRETRAY